MTKNCFPETDIKIPSAEGLSLPQMFMLERKIETEKVVNPENIIMRELRKVLLNRFLKEKEVDSVDVESKRELKEETKEILNGKRIAITVGSRGIPSLPAMVKAMGDVIKSLGGSPFIVPAMGSHGGGTAEGQREVLKEYGVTEKELGIPILASMETICYGEVKGVKAFCDKNAAEADGIIIFNKVKPHTMFHGKLESGLAKMMAVGLGKHDGAAAIHSLDFERFSDIIPEVAEKFLNEFNVLAGISVIQNENDEIFSVDVMQGNEIMDREPSLLQTARDHLSRFPLQEVDLLIIDEIGKNISGSGFDPNVFARWDDSVHSEHTGTKYKRLFIRSLTKESHGMGTGAPHADVASKRFIEQVNWSATWTNAITCNLAVARGIPIYFGSDRDAISALLKLFAPKRPEELDIVWVKNSLELDKFLASSSIIKKLRDKNIPVTVRDDAPYQIIFDDDGYILSPFSRAHCDL